METIKVDPIILDAFGVDSPPMHNVIDVKQRQCISETLIRINDTLPIDTSDEYTTMYLQMGGADDNNISTFIENHHKKQKNYLLNIRQALAFILTSIKNNKVSPDSTNTNTNTSQHACHLHKCKTVAVLTNAETQGDIEAPTPITDLGRASEL